MVGALEPVVYLRYWQARDNLVRCPGNPAKLQIEAIQAPCCIFVRSAKLAQEGAMKIGLLPAKDIFKMLNNSGVGVRGYCVTGLPCGSQKCERFAPALLP